jgi:hypothetical protein
MIEDTHNYECLTVYTVLNWGFQTHYSGVFDTLSGAKTNASGNLLQRKTRKCSVVVHRKKKPPKDGQNHPD